MTERLTEIVLSPGADPLLTTEAVRMMIEKEVGVAVEFSIALGDIARVKAEAIVCPGNRSFEFANSGVQRAVVAQAGWEPFNEARRKALAHIDQVGGVFDRRGYTGLPTGFATTTTAGDLQGIKRIIHVNNFSAEIWPPCDTDVVRLSVASALAEADQAGMKSIAFPALGTGLWRLSMAQSIAGTILGMQDHFSQTPDSGIKKVIFLVHAQATQDNALTMQRVLLDEVPLILADMGNQ